MVRPVQFTAGEDEPVRPDQRGGGRHRRQKKRQPFWLELLILLLVATGLAMFVQFFFFKVYMIPSGSMRTTLHIGDRILVDKITYDFSDPEPGDVVVFKGPPSWTENDLLPESSDNAVVQFLQEIGSLVGIAPPDEKDFVKRVVATGGQTIWCCDQQNRVVVDGQPLHEPYIYWAPTTPPVQESFEPVVVPEDTVFVLGDNRNRSCDSRCQGGGGQPGVVPVENIIGEARLVVLPPSRWGGVGDHNPQRVH